MLNLAYFIVLDQKLKAKIACDTIKYHLKIFQNKLLYLSVQGKFINIPYLYDICYKLKSTMFLKINP